MPTISKKTLKKDSSAKKPSSNIKSLVDDMADLDVRKAAPIKVQFYSLNWNFLQHFYSFSIGCKNVLFMEFLVMNLPKNFLKQGRVVSRGFKFSLQMAIPKWFFEESYAKRVLGDEYDERHASVQTSSSHAIQLICRKYNTLDYWLMSEPQLIDLPFPCIEGDYTPHWGNWSTKGMARVSNHKQLQKSITFKLISVEDLLKRVEATKETEDGFANSSNNDDDASDDEAAAGAHMEN